VGFATPDGTRVPAVTAAEMAAVDRAAEDRGLAVLSMMESAGRALAEVVAGTASGAEPRSGGPVVVLAGAGGNGGGGLCAARHLANAGDEVRVVLDRDPADLTGPAATQRRVLGATDAAVGTDETALDGAAVVVDALVGYGLTDALRGRAAALVDAIPPVPTVSLDVPSGVDADTGEAPGVAVDPDRTLTLALPKPGLATAGGALELADLGIPAGVCEAAGVESVHPFGGALRIPLDRT
jgi:NAD(P)H-hydrate epimerase